MTCLIFNEYEAFAEAIGEASIKMRLTALEQSKWTLQQAVAGAVRLQKGFEGGGSIAEGETVNDGWVFYYQFSPGQANGETTTLDDIFVAPPGSEFCLTCHPLHEWLTIYIPTSLLFSFEHELEFASSAGPLLLKPPAQVTHSFMSLARRFLATAESRPQMLGFEMAVESFQHELLAAAKELFFWNRNCTNRHFNRWRHQVKLAERLALTNPGLSLSIEELALKNGVQERTLRRAFQRYYGLSPVEYMRLRRLHHARRLLMVGCPGQTTVTKIAFELGFWDLGRFAGTYRQLFGERPSETLRKPVRVSIGSRQP
jgi:AraC-like DNA-binding protein